jgi:hypothetical protein
MFSLARSSLLLTARTTESLVAKSLVAAQPARSMTILSKESGEQYKKEVSLMRARVGIGRRSWMAHVHVHVHVQMRLYHAE